LEGLKGYQRNLIVAVVLAVLSFFWIWFYRSIGGAGYWAALVAFAVYVASGSSARKLPWMVLGGVVGVVLGLVTFALGMLVFPPYAVISSAIAGVIFILIGGLISVPRLPDILPMYLVGWACFLGAMSQFDYLFLEKVVWANLKATNTFFGVLLSVLVGLLFAALIATPLLGERPKPATPQAG